MRVGGVSGGADLAAVVLVKLLARRKWIDYLASRYSGGISIFCGDGAGVVWHFHHTEASWHSPAPAPPRIRVVVIHGVFCPGFSVIILGSHSGMAGTGKTTEVPAVHFLAYKRIFLITRPGSVPCESACRASLVS